MPKVPLRVRETPCKPHSQDVGQDWVENALVAAIALGTATGEAAVAEQVNSAFLALASKFPIVR